MKILKFEEQQATAAALLNEEDPEADLTRESLYWKEDRHPNPSISLVAIVVVESITIRRCP